MLDVARVETIEPAAERHVPSVPTVHPVHPGPVTPVHRHAPAVTAASGVGPLTSADVEVAFDAAPERERPLPKRLTWTVEQGFVDDDGGTADVGPTTEEPRLRYLPTSEQRLERPPRDLVDLVEQATGVNVGDAVIDRSATVSGRAAELGALAFTERGTVHLPPELGEIGEPGVSGIVAHELTHVAQQRSRSSEVPAEDSGEGRALEAEARAVQRAAGGAVRPDAMRRRAYAPESRAGVQRLADDDGEPNFAWQGRGTDDDMSPSQERSALGLFGGFTWRRGSVGDRALQREDERYRRQFEIDHRDELLQRRREHFDEIVERRLEAKRSRAPEDVRDDVELNRTEVLAAREQLDRDMPFEFELPATVDPYPGDLPEPGPDDDVEPPTDVGPTVDPTPAVRRAPVTGATGAAAGSTARAAGAGGRSTPPRAPGAPGARRGAASTRGGGSTAGGFDWQHREPTDQQAVQSLFGGGLLGELIGRAVGEETDDDRRRAEADRLPDLLVQRHDRERELRHRLLQDKLRVRTTEARREERTPSDRSISLTDEEITGIREQIDAEMPLQYAVPTYLATDQAATIDAGGRITNGRTEPVDEQAPAAATTTDGDAAAETAAGPGEAPTGSQDAVGGDAAAESGAPPAATDRPAAADEPSGSSPAVGGGRSASGSLMTAATLGLAADGVLDRGASGVGSDADDHGSVASGLLAAATELDIDVLSRRIWSRIRREMRSELLVDRERAGALADHR